MLELQDWSGKQDRVYRRMTTSGVRGRGRFIATFTTQRNKGEKQNAHKAKS